MTNRDEHSKFFFYVIKVENANTIHSSCECSKGNRSPKTEPWLFLVISTSFQLQPPFTPRVFYRLLSYSKAFQIILVDA